MLQSVQLELRQRGFQILTEPRRIKHVEDDIFQLPIEMLRDHVQRWQRMLILLIDHFTNHILIHCKRRNTVFFLRTSSPIPTSRNRRRRPPNRYRTTRRFFELRFAELGIRLSYFASIFIFFRKCND